MLTLGALALAVAPSAFAGSGLSQLRGVYVSDNGNRFIVDVQGQAVVLRTNAELSRYGLCKAPLKLISNVTRSSDFFAEAIFKTTNTQCNGIDGPITLHFNVAPFGGAHIYLVDIVIRAGRGSRDRGQTMRWSLTKTRN